MQFAFSHSQFSLPWQYPRRCRSLLHVNSCSSLWRLIPHRQLPHSLMAIAWIYFPLLAILDRHGGLLFPHGSFVRLLILSFLRSSFPSVDWAVDQLLLNDNCKPSSEPPPNLSPLFSCSTTSSSSFPDCPPQPD